MSDYDIHSCGYYCDRHACIVAQRDELRDKLFEGQAVKTYSGGKPNYTEPEEKFYKQAVDGTIPEAYTPAKGGLLPKREPSGSWTSWDNTMCNPLADARMQTQSAWQDGYDSAKAEGYAPSENNRAYERGFIDGQQKQIESAVHKAVNAMGKKEWVGLTDDERDEIREQAHYEFDDISNAIEAKLKEKNNG
jgi:hypothetical protein